MSTDAKIEETMSTKEKMIVLISSDKQSFQIKEAAAVKSVIIKNIIEDDYDGADIPMPNVTAKILALVVEFCNRHVEEKPETEGAKAETEGTDDDLKAFYAEFVKVDQETLFDLILAANYLNIKELLDLTCQTVADMIKSKTPEQIRAIFNIVNDFTPEEEAEIRRENTWAFEE